MNQRASHPDRSKELCMAVLPISDARISLVAPLTPTAVTSETHCNGATSTATADSWEPLLDELHRLRGLDEDWDGQGAEAPQIANVDYAMAWLRQMRRQTRAFPPSRVAPGVAGEIVIEWQGQ